MRLFRRLVRYATVSLIASSLSMTVLGLLVLTGTTTAGWANVVATAAGTVPSFELNRRWVWKRTGTRSLLAEIGPFTALSFIALALSTVAVSLAAGWASSSGLGTTARALAAEAASVASFGSMWIVQYVLLDRFLFSPRRAGGHDIVTTLGAFASSVPATLSGAIVPAEQWGTEPHRALVAPVDANR